MNKYLLASIIKNLICFVLVIILTKIFDVFFNWSLFISFSLSCLIIIIFLSIKERRLMKETINTMIKGSSSGIIYKDISRKYFREGDFTLSTYASPEIKLGGKKFIVLRYGGGIGPNSPITGVVIINKNKSKKVSKKEAIIIKNLYRLWEDIYFNPILSENYKKGIINIREALFRDRSNDLIPSNFKKFKKVYLHEIYSYKISKKRIQNEKNYEKEIGKEFIPLLKELDFLTIKQHEKLTHLFKKIMNNLEKIYEFFEKPSKELYESFIKDCESLRKIYLNPEIEMEMKKRVGLWKKIEEGRKAKKIRGGFIIGMVIDSFQFLTKYPIPFATIIVGVFNGFINLGIKTYNLIKIGHISYSKFGIDAIEQALKMKEGVFSSTKRYKTILNDTSSGIIRNLNEFV